MEIKAIVWTCAMIFLLIGYVISKVFYLKKQNFRSKVFETIFLMLLIIGQIASLILRNHLIAIRCIIVAILVVFLINNIIFLRRMPRKGDHFVRIQGRTYIVRNIYPDD